MVLTHEAFYGRWALARVITHRDGPGGCTEGDFEGRAEITPGGLYTETGTLRMGAQAFAATRRYRWAPVLGGFDISFDDGRAFHALRFDDPSARHWCDPDTYEVAYDFAQMPLWSARWRVRGPRKDYVIITRYSPLRAG